MMVVKREENRGRERRVGKTAAPGKNPPFLLAHLSDPHLFSTAGSWLPDFFNKRLYGYLLWRWRRRHEHGDRVALAMIEDLHRQRPSHIAVTGDLTHLGLSDEYRRAAEFLRRLGPPEQVAVIPGNHDAYVKSAWEKGHGLWAPYLAGDDGLVSFPFVRQRGNVCLIGLSTARPCPPYLATGTLGRAQLWRLDVILAERGSRGQCRVVLIHHPPVAGVVSWRKRLTDHRAFCEVLRRRGAELVLHGHAHRPSCVFVDSSSGRVPVVGVPAATAFGRRPERRAEYNLYRIVRESQAWRISFKRRRYAIDSNDFSDRDGWKLLLP